MFLCIPNLEEPALLLMCAGFHRHSSDFRGAPIQATAGVSKGGLGQN